MAALNKSEASLLRSVMKEAGWDIVLRLLGQEIDRINAEEVNGASEFEELRVLHKKQGRVTGLKDFFEYLERGATD